MGEFCGCAIQTLKFVPSLVFLWEQIHHLSKRVKQKMLFKTVPMRLTRSLISGALKSKNLALVEERYQAVEASGDKLVKVIVRTCLLTDDEKDCLLAKLLSQLAQTL